MSKQIKCIECPKYFNYIPNNISEDINDLNNQDNSKGFLF